MANRRGPQIQMLDPAENERLAKIRSRASHEQMAFLDANAPTDPLGALAWIAGATGPAPASPLDGPLLARIELARRERFTWREIAAAMGEGDSADDARRVRDRFAFWSKP